MSTVFNLFTNISNQTDCTGPALQSCEQRHRLRPRAAAEAARCPGGGREAAASRAELFAGGWVCAEPGCILLGCCPQLREPAGVCRRQHWGCVHRCCPPAWEPSTAPAALEEQGQIRARLCGGRQGSKYVVTL